MTPKELFTKYNKLKNHKKISMSVARQFLNGYTNGMPSDEDLFVTFVDWIDSMPF